MGIFTSGILLQTIFVLTLLAVSSMSSPSSHEMNNTLPFLQMSTTALPNRTSVSKTTTNQWTITAVASTIKKRKTQPTDGTFPSASKTSNTQPTYTTVAGPNKTTNIQSTYTTVASANKTTNAKTTYTTVASKNKTTNTKTTYTTVASGNKTTNTKATYTTVDNANKTTDIQPTYTTVASTNKTTDTHPTYSTVGSANKTTNTPPTDTMVASESKTTNTQTTYSTVASANKTTNTQTTYSTVASANKTTNTQITYSTVASENKTTNTQTANTFYTMVISANKTTDTQPTHTTVPNVIMPRTTQQPDTTVASSSETTNTQPLKTTINITNGTDTTNAIENKTETKTSGSTLSEKSFITDAPSRSSINQTQAEAEYRKSSESTQLKETTFTTPNGTTYTQEVDHKKGTEDQYRLIITFIGLALAAFVFFGLFVRIYCHCQCKRNTPRQRKENACIGSAENGTFLSDFGTSNIKSYVGENYGKAAVRYSDIKPQVSQSMQKEKLYLKKSQKTKSTSTKEVNGSSSSRKRSLQSPITSCSLQENQEYIIDITKRKQQRSARDILNENHTNSPECTKWHSKGNFRLLIVVLGGSSESSLRGSVSSTTSSSFASVRGSNNDVE